MFAHLSYNDPRVQTTVMISIKAIHSVIAVCKPLLRTPPSVK